MADGFEPYHVPQQSRRDKLRETTNHHLHSYGVSSPLFPALYDPCLLPSDLINLHRQSYNLGVKEESNFMGFVPGLNLTSSSSTIPTNQVQPMFADPQLSIQESFPYYRASGFDNYGGKDHQTLSLELNLQSCDDSEVYSNVNNKAITGYVVAGNGSGCVDMTRSAVPLGPFTGYALVLNGSRFLKPAQLLMEELCDVSRGVYGDRNEPNPGLMDPPPFDGVVVDEALTCSIDAGEQTRTKSGLISMLNEAYKRYRMYYQQMQAVVASFESVAGLSNAAPFANLALRALTRHFRSLKMAINDQLLSASKSQGKVINYEKNESELVVSSGKVHYGGTRSFQHAAGFSEQPVVWRPQRGLPERAVTVLRAWLFEHFLHPYPTDTDKMMLAKQTGLSRNQVSNWFINARVRLWKPMVEEIHTLETHQGKKHSQREELSINRVHDNTPTSPSINQSDNASTSMQRLGEFPMKRTREDVMEPSRSREIPLRFAYESLSNDQPLGGGMNNASSSGGVSLTLGLHQNGMGLSESYPMNAARRFGLDSHGDGYALSGYVTQGRQFGRDIMG